MKVKYCGQKLNIETVTERRLFELAGYDYNKFDSACPQNFFTAKLELGIKDRYGWYYGDKDTKLFGRPLSLLELLNKLMGDSADLRTGKLCIVTKEDD